MMGKIANSEKIQGVEVKIQRELGRVKESLSKNEGAKSCTFVLTDDSLTDTILSMIYQNGNIEVVKGTVESTDCTMTLRYSDFIDLFDRPYHSYYLAWQGRVDVQGDKSVMVWFDNLIFSNSGHSGNIQAGQYSALSRLFPDPKFQFMNLGYASEEIDVLPTDLWYYSKELLEETIWRKDLDHSTILDVGSGRGGNVKYLANKFENSYVTGLDSCTEAIEFCKKNITDLRTEFVAGDACNLPFDQNSFDHIVNLESAHCYKEIDRFLRGALNVLKPGGTLFLTDILKTSKVDEMSALLEMIGFQIEKTKDVSDGVVRAIIQNGENFKSFLESRKNKKNGWIVDNLINSVNQHFQDSLMNKYTVYYSWLLSKPMN